MIKFICYPKCTTCQKAQKWLDAKGIEYTVRNIKENNPTEEELTLWYKVSGSDIKKFFNTSGQSYRAMNLREKLLCMTDEEKIKLLASDGMLVRRPLLIGEDFVLTGFREAQWEEKLTKL